MTTRKSHQLPPKPGRPRFVRGEDKPLESRNNSDSNHASESGGANQIYGLIPVLEALKAGNHKLEQITIAEGARHERLRELLDLAKHARVPVNLGAILRTAECAGVNGVFIPERRAVGLTATVAKTAAGALEHISVARVTNLVQLIEQLKQRNIWVIGAAADGSSDYTEWDWTVPSALFLGGEGTGLHRLVRERCDALVRIPLLGRIESLNVSVAAGVILYEALRQRSVGKLKR
jgi:tRNA G18 (ribose-2'-O)-methylase SpoU